MPALCLADDMQSTARSAFGASGVGVVWRVGNLVVEIGVESGELRCTPRRAE